MQINPDFQNTPSEDKQHKLKFDLLGSNPIILQMALKASKTGLWFVKNVFCPNPNIPKRIEKEKSVEQPIDPMIRQQIEKTLKNVMQEQKSTEEISKDPFMMLPQVEHEDIEKDLLNEVLFRIEKGFLALQINEHEVFSEGMLQNLLNQIPNPADRKELLMNSTIESFSHMAVNQEGEENVVHILELATPPQKIMVNLPHLYIVKWQIYPDGVSITKESEYTLVTSIKKDHSEEIIPLYKYQEIIDFRSGQQKHHIQIEPSQKGFDPVNHRLIWNF